MRRHDYIFGQFRETARCRDAQHGDRVCCAFAPQLVSFCYSVLYDLWHHGLGQALDCVMPGRCTVG